MSQKRIERYDFQDVVLGDELHPLLARIYSNRGVSCKTELEKQLKNLHSFNELKGIDEAVEIIFSHFSKHILIVGDFDADGATSTALAVRILRVMGASQVSYLVPNRFDYGYGLTPEIVEEANKQKPSLIITVDNGISSVDGVAKAKSLGIDVVVTDHHLAGDVLPDADAIVNPNQPGCSFPSKSLAGVGVIFYVMLALRQYCRAQQWFENKKEPNLATYLDIVALGTVADVVPLDKNNRILVHQGLRRIQNGRAIAGINAILKIAGRDHQHIVASDLGFAVGPRLNAAGRLDDMSFGIECLLCDDDVLALEMATKLDELNQERRQIEKTMKKEALSLLHSLNLAKIKNSICLFDKNWHQGVIGILAGRIKDQYYRPTVIFAKGDDGFIKGSARSVKGVHIRDLLDIIDKRHSGLIIKFGGHAMAAGLTIAEKNLKTFAAEFEKTASELIANDILENILLSDGELEGADFNLELAKTLKQAGPWGQQFPEPLFDGEFQVIDQRIVGKDHLKLTLCHPISGELIDAIAFQVNTERWPNHRADKIHAAYRLDINRFRGKESLQLIVEHMEVTT